MFKGKWRENKQIQANRLARKREQQQKDTEQRNCAYLNTDDFRVRLYTYGNYLVEMERSTMQEGKMQ